MAKSIFIGSPDTNFLNEVEVILKSLAPESSITTISDFKQLLHLAPQQQEAIILSDVFWDNQNYAHQLSNALLSNPNLAWGIISPYDLTGYLPAFFPMPYVCGSADPHAIENLLINLSEDLRGQNLGTFQIKEFVAQTHMGRAYLAHQEGINRDVFLTLAPLTASPEEKQTFHSTCTVLAHNINPSIYAIYESGDFDDRPFLASEPIRDITLLQLIGEAKKLDDRHIARIMKTTTTILLHMKEASLASQPLAPHLITLSKQGVVKIANTAIPEEMISESAQLQQIADALYPLIDEDVEHHPDIAELYDLLQTGEIPLEEAAQKGILVDTKLAPAQYVPERTEAVKAKKAVAKAKQKSFIGFAIGALVCTVIALFLILDTLNKHVDLPGKDFSKEQVLIPEGSINLLSGEKVTVKPFYMDKYEVTIGMYEKFLESPEIKNTTPEKYLGSLWNGDKKSFEPEEWLQLLQAVKTRSSFKGSPGITRDHPIINIDFYDAYAYAKWAGKRLPSEHEWQRAASGNNNLKIPWGNKVTAKDLERANTGYDMNPQKNREAGSVDGHRGPGAVNAFPDDISPFGVIGLGGNVSEWTIQGDGSKLKSKTQIYRGSNYQIPSLFSNSRSSDIPSDTNKDWLGFRCVSDAPSSK